MIRYLLFAILAWGLVSCYEDKGNYTYHDINEVSVDSLNSFYTIDQFDTLKIDPVIAGTQYSDTARFNYAWEIDGKVVSSSALLRYKVMNSPGEKYCRLIIEDKDTKVKEYYYFHTNVVSTTAVDGIMLLSNYKNHAELSFKRVDRETAPFQVNFYNDMNKTWLGTVPQKMIQVFNYELNDDNDLYGLQILTDNQIRRVSYKTLLEDEIHPIYNKDYFKSIIPVSPGYPDFGNFHTENLSSSVLTWMGDFMGPFQRIVYNSFISNGKFFMIMQSPVAGGVADMSYLRESELGGKLSPVYFNVSMKKNGQFSSFFYDIGYTISDNMITYDQDNYRFLYGNYRSKSTFKEIQELSTLNLEGYEPVFGSPTRNLNNPVVVISNGSTYRCLVFQAPQNDNEYQPGQTTGIKFKIINDLTVPTGLMNKYSDFYCYITDEDFYFSTDGTLYSVNIQSLINGSWSAKPICQLTDFGYDAEAKINCFDITRSGKYLVLGVSTDGKRKDESSDELNGDVLLLNLEKNNNTITLKNKFEQVGGTPTDIILKYLSYFCEGFDENKTFRDYL